MKRKYCLHCGTYMWLVAGSLNGYCVVCIKMSAEGGVVLRGLRKCASGFCLNHSDKVLFRGNWCSPCYETRLEKKSLRRLAKAADLVAKGLSSIDDHEGWSKPEVVVNFYKNTSGACMRYDEPCKEDTCRYHVHSDARRDQVALSGDLPVTSSLKLANGGGMTLEAVGMVMGVTRERIRQIEYRASARLAQKLERLGFTSEMVTHFIHRY